MKHSILNICGWLHQWHSRAKCTLKQSHRAWIHSPSHYINTASFSGCGCFISSVALGDSSHTSRPRRFLCHSFTAVPTVQCWGWLCAQTGDRHSGPAVWLVPNILDLLRSLDFQLVEDDSPSGIGRVNSTGELVCSLSLSFTFSHIIPPLSLKCFNCFCWAEEEKIRKVGFCQSNHIVLSILIMRVGLCISSHLGKQS